jgi:hypothetical protein
MYLAGLAGGIAAAIAVACGGRPRGVLLTLGGRAIAEQTAVRVQRQKTA